MYLKAASCGYLPYRDGVDMLAYFSLFAIAFFAATLLPLSSEVLFGALLTQEYSLAALLFWAARQHTRRVCELVARHASSQ